MDKLLEEIIDWEKMDKLLEEIIDWEKMDKLPVVDTPRLDIQKMHKPFFRSGSISII